MKHFSISFLHFTFQLALQPYSTLAQTPFGHVSPENAVLFLNGFHFISGNTGAELSANYHCSIISDDFIQCAVYNTALKPARLAGIEYIISSALFEKLDYEERQLWHSHVYEVKSGFLIEPNFPEALDHTAMEILIGTYGKTVHTWRYDQQNNTVPIGVPELVVGYTGDSQITPDFVMKRDELFGVNTTAIRKSRADIVAPHVNDGAESWRKGFVLTYGILNTTSNTTFS